MGIRDKAVNSSVWSIVGVLANQVVSFVVLGVMARHLRAEDFGVVAFVVLFVELSRTVMLGGLPDALIREPVWDNSLASTVFWALLGAGVILSAVGVVFGVMLVRLEYLTTGYVLLGISICFIFDALTATQTAWLAHDFEFKKITTQAILANALGGAAALVGLMEGLQVGALVLQRIIASLSQAALIWRQSGWRPDITFSWRKLRSSLTFSSRLMVSNLLGTANIRAVDFVIGALLGPAALGTYQIASRWLNVLLQLTISPTQQVAISAFAKLDSRQNLGAAYLRVVRVTALLSFPAFLGASVVAPELMEVSFGTTWKEAWPIMSTLMLIGWPATITFFLSSALSALGQSRELLRFSGFTVVASLSVAVLIAPFGLATLAVGFLLRSLFTASVALWLLRRSLSIQVADMFVALGPPAFCSVLMACGVSVVRRFWLNDAPSFLSLCALTAVGMLVYTLALLLFARAALRHAAQELSPILPVSVRRRLEENQGGGR